MAVRLFRGDTLLLAWGYYDADGQPIDLTGASVRMMARDDEGNMVLSASTADGRISADENGRIDLEIPYTETEALAPGSYRFDVEVTLPSGFRRTIDQDALVVLEDVTHD